MRLYRDVNPSGKDALLVDLQALHLEWEPKTGVRIVWLQSASQRLKSCIEQNRMKAKAAELALFGDLDPCQGLPLAS